MLKIGLYLIVYHIHHMHTNPKHTEKS